MFLVDTHWRHFRSSAPKSLLHGLFFGWQNGLASMWNPLISPCFSHTTESHAKLNNTAWPLLILKLQQNITIGRTTGNQFYMKRLNKPAEKAHDPTRTSQEWKTGDTLSTLQLLKNTNKHVKGGWVGACQAMVDGKKQTEPCTKLCDPRTPTH